MLQLRPYQQEAIDAVAQAEADGVRSALICLPTGTGKTVIFSHLAKRREGRTLVLVHRDELIRQAVGKIQQIAPDAWVGVVKAGENEALAQVVVGSVQTLSRPARRNQIGEFDLVIIDEAHHAVADSYRETLKAFGAGERVMLVGVTATPGRSDKVGLGAVFQKIVYERSILEMIRSGYLCDLRGKAVETRMDLSEVRVRAGEFVESDLDKAVNRTDLNATVADAYLTEASGRQAIVFAVSVSHAKALADAFKGKGIPAAAVYGDMDEGERKSTLAAFHRKELRALTNCNILTEGFDEPAVSAILMARPTKSEGLYQQMAGRGTRLYPGKENCLILDFAGNTEQHGLVTLPSLFGLNPKHRSAAERSLAEAVEEQEQEAQILAGKAAKWQSKVVDLFARSPFRWATVEGVMILPAGTEGRILLLEQEGGWVAKVFRRDGALESIMERPMDAGYAQGIAEDWVRAQGAMSVASKDAPWRKTPASVKQLEMLTRFRLPFLEGVTKGEASDLLDNYFAVKDLKRMRRQA